MKKLIALFTIVLISVSSLLADTITQVALKTTDSFLTEVVDADGFSYQVNILTINLSPEQQALVASALSELQTAIAPAGATISGVWLNPSRTDGVVDNVSAVVEFTKDNKKKTVSTSEGDLNPSTKASLIATWNGLEALAEAQLKALAVEPVE